MSINNHIYNVIIEDHYDYSNLIACRKCGGSMNLTNICEWCDDIPKKEADFKTGRFSIDKDQFHKIKDIIASIDDKYWTHDTKMMKKSYVVEKFGLYPTQKFSILKESLVKIGCKISDLDIIQLNLGDPININNITYDSKLAISKILNTSDAILEYEVKTNKEHPIDVIQLTIKVPSVDFKNQLRKIFVL